MVTVAFTELVFALFDRYCRSVEDRQRAGECLANAALLEWRFAVEHGALPLGCDRFVEYYVHPSGRLFPYDTWNEEPGGEFDDDWTLALALRVGSRRYPELLAHLPVRPPQAATCTACGGTGRTTAGEDWLACQECYGLGWLPRELDSLVEQAVVELRAAGEKPEQITALAHRFRDEASSLLGVVLPAVALFDAALRRAGFGPQRHRRYAEVYEMFRQHAQEASEESQ
jgi:hypothetical protein